MDRKIGKAVLLVSIGLLAGALHAVSVSLRVSDHQGNPLQQAGVGVPFLIQVEVITEGRQESARPHLTLPAKIGMAQLGTTSSVRTVNSDTVSKKTYQYSAVCQEEGPVVVGPATVLLPDGKEVRSNEVRVTVSEQQKAAQTSDKTDAFVQMSVDNPTPYVGQAVALTLRFYYASDAVHLEQLQEPVFKDCKAAPLQGPTNGHATIKETRYGYLEWKTTLFPSRTGKMTFPAIAAYITLPVPQSRGRGLDMFAMVNQMLGGGKQEQLYSNSLTLNVLALPTSGAQGDQVTAVGKFTSLNAKLGSEKAQTGEGISFTLELVGEGNFGMIAHPLLELPEGLKYYDSHAKEHTLSEKMRKKDFEYVLQAVAPGVYEIPAQSFNYFDSKTKAYKTVTSRPIKLTVSGNHKKHSTQPFQEEYQEQPAKVTSTHDTDQFALERNLKGAGGATARSIPWNWFAGIAGFLLLLLGLKGLHALWLSYRQRNALHFQSKGAFVHAHQSVKNAKKNKRGSELYHIFMGLFAARLKLSQAEISEAFIEKKLKEAGLSNDQILSWRHFFSHTLAVTFAVVPETEDMYVQAEQWLMLLERIL